MAVYTVHVHHTDGTDRIYDDVHVEEQENCVVVRSDMKRTVVPFGGVKAIHIAEKYQPSYSEPDA